ncbi:MAG: hypothetical protein AAB817_02720, partial [Patescibacteria group bacterium]
PISTTAVNPPASSSPVDGLGPTNETPTTAANGSAPITTVGEGSETAAPPATTPPTVPEMGQPVKLEGVVLQLPVGRDADRDGLTDVEEILYGSDRNKPDTDLDGYLDGEEIKAGYSATGINQKLTAGGLVKLYSNTASGYQILYPALWRLDTPGSTETVSFISPTTTDFIELIFYGPVTTSLDRWYQEVIAPKTGSAPAPTAETLKTWRLLRSGDQLTVYLKSAKTNTVYALTYNPGTEKELHFSATFALMINSLVEIAK